MLGERFGDLLVTGDVEIVVADQHLREGLAAEWDELGPRGLGRGRDRVVVGGADGRVVAVARGDVGDEDTRVRLSS